MSVKKVIKFCEGDSSLILLSVVANYISKNQLRGVAFVATEFGS